MAETPELAEDVAANATCHQRMRVVVIATTPKGTVAALRNASCGAADLDAQITLVAMQAVPWEFPLQRPPMSVAALERKLYALVYEAGIVENEVVIQLCLCRDKREALRKLLPPHSLVVIGYGNRWWSRRERILKAFLTSMGHRVMLSKSSPNNDKSALQKAD